MTIMQSSFECWKRNHLIKEPTKQFKQIIQNKHQLNQKKPKNRKDLQLPELKLRKPANEGLEFIRAFCRQQRPSPTRNFHLRINQRRQEPNQQIQEINPQTIGDNVKPLNVINPQNVNQHYNSTPNPSIDRVWSSLI